MVVLLKVMPVVSFLFERATLWECFDSPNLQPRNPFAIVNIFVVAVGRTPRAIIWVASFHLDNSYIFHPFNLHLKLTRHSILSLTLRLNRFVGGINFANLAFY